MRKQASELIRNTRNGTRCRSTITDIIPQLVMKLVEDDHFFRLSQTLNASKSELGVITAREVRLFKTLSHFILLLPSRPSQVAVCGTIAWLERAAFFTAIVRVCWEACLFSASWKIRKRCTTLKLQNTHAQTWECRGVKRGGGGVDERKKVTDI